MSTQSTLTIDHLGSHGEGVAEHDGRKVFVPFTLPGEREAVEIDGERGALLRVETPSLERIAPVCRHFGICGGCALQHAGPPVYGQFKRDQVLHALASRGFTDDVPVAELVPIAAGTRRRASFAVSRNGDEVVLGYHQARSQVLVNIEQCPVLRPTIVSELANLHVMLMIALARRASAALHVTDTGHGLDVVLDGGGVEMNAKRRAALGAWMNAAPAMLRLTVDGEQIGAREQPVISISGYAVALPARSFLQAASEAESAMIGLIRDGLGKLKKPDRIADLFAGLGAFSLALADRNEVLAVEWDAPAVAALTAAARQPGLRKLDVLRRDLFREPLSARELEPFAAVVFDPPRAGAQAQAEALAASTVRTVIAVSCNPATFARDARVLIDAGFVLERVLPVDQFLWSPHIELVAGFRRDS